MFDLTPHRWMRKRKRRGDPNCRAGRCAWVEDATDLSMCGRSIHPGTFGYCSKHTRMFLKMTRQKPKPEPPATD